MLCCLAKTDDVRFIASLRVGHVHNDAIQPAKQVDPLLPIGTAGVFPGDDGSIKDSFASDEIQAVVLDVAKTL
jgi:hypothetical protein